VKTEERQSDGAGRMNFDGRLSDLVEFVEAEGFGALQIIDGDRGKSYPSKSEMNPNGYCLFLNTGNIKNDAFDFSSGDFISIERDTKLRKGKLSRNDLVLTTRGTIGAVGYYHSRIPFAQLRINSGMIIVRAGSQLDSGYLYQVLKSSFLKQQFSLFESGAAQPQLPIKDLRRIKFPFPPLPIQRKIAAVLSAYDDLIENNNRRIALLEKMAEELYREWFVRLRFPGHEKVKVVKGVPEGWEVSPIGSLIQHQIGGGWGAETPSGSENQPVYIVRGTDFKNLERGKFDTLPLRYETSGSISSRSLRHGDIVLENSVNAQSRTAGNTILITQKMLDQFEYPLIPASFCKLIRFVDIDLSFFLWKYMKCYYDQGLMEYFQNIATNGIANFQVGRFLERFEVVIPDKRELYTDLWAFDSSTQLDVLSKLTKSRDRLLSRLMSGKVDLTDLDIAFPPSMREEAAHG